MADRPLVIVTRKLPDVVETRLRELFDARLNLEDKPFTREELGKLLELASGGIARLIAAQREALR